MNLTPGGSGGAPNAEDWIGRDWSLYRYYTDIRYNLFLGFTRTCDSDPLVLFKQCISNPDYFIFDMFYVEFFITNLETVEINPILGKFDNSTQSSSNRFEMRPPNTTAANRCGTLSHQRKTYHIGSLPLVNCKKRW